MLALKMLLPFLVLGCAAEETSHRTVGQSAESPTFLNSPGGPADQEVDMSHCICDTTDSSDYMIYSNAFGRKDKGRFPSGIFLTGAYCINFKTYKPDLDTGWYQYIADPNKANDDGSRPLITSKFHYVGKNTCAQVTTVTLDTYEGITKLGRGGSPQQWNRSQEFIEIKNVVCKEVKNYTQKECGEGLAPRVF